MHKLTSVEAQRVIAVMEVNHVIMQGHGLCFSLALELCVRHDNVQ